MTQRKLRRRWRWKGRARRQPTYAHHSELHAYEDSVVMRLVRERGTASVREWTDLEPGRWRPRRLFVVLKRLEERGELRRSGYYTGGWLRRRSVQFTVNEERKAA